MVTQRAPATTALVESNAPDWAQRLGLRLPKTFQGLYPIQPTHLWDAGAVGNLPPAADWPGGVAAAGGVIWLSNGTSWVPVGPATDAALAPQFDNDTSIANTAWVNRVGHQFSSRIVVSGNTVLNATAAGALVIINTAGAVVTLPPAASFPSATTISFTVQAGPVSVKAAGADVINMGAGLPTTVTMNAADTLELVSNGTTAWVANGGSAQLAFGSSFALAPQFDASGKLATTAWVQQRGLQTSGQYVYAANTVMTAAQAGSRVQLRDNITVTLPLASAVALGSQILFYGGNNGAIVASGADLIYHGGSGTASLNIGIVDTALLTAYGAGVGWVVDGGSLALPGSATMNNWPLAPQFDASGKLATTAFVQRALWSFAGAFGWNANTALTVAHVGGYNIVFANVTLTLPPNSAVGAAGATMFFQNAAGGSPFTLAAAAGEMVFNPNSGTVASFVVAAGKSVMATRGFSKDWYLSGTGV